MSKTSTYKSWCHLIQRCTNIKNTNYHNYGSRGITVCKRWFKFKEFFADMGERPKGLTIERKDNNLGYFKENCKWATPIEQNRNRRISPNNTTGIAGVVWRPLLQKYLARIAVANKDIHLGYFKTLEEAAAARQVGELKHWCPK